MVECLCGSHYLVWKGRCPQISETSRGIHRTALERRGVAYSVDKDGAAYRHRDKYDVRSMPQFWAD